MPPITVVEVGFGRGRPLEMVRAVLPSSRCGPADGNDFGSMQDFRKVKKEPT
jgi:hypothetical protein